MITWREKPLMFDQIVAESLWPKHRLAGFDIDYYPNRYLLLRNGMVVCSWGHLNPPEIRKVADKIMEKEDGTR